MIYFLRRNLCLPTCWLELPFILFYWKKENNESHLMVRTILIFFALFCLLMIITYHFMTQDESSIFHFVLRCCFIILRNFTNLLSRYVFCWITKYPFESYWNLHLHTCLSLVFSATYHLIVQLFLVIVKRRKWFHVKIYSHRVTFLLIMIANTD